MRIKTLSGGEKMEYSMNFLRVWDGNEVKESYEIGGLVKISVLTTDQGPFIDDIALALFWDEAALAVPCGHPSYDNLYDYLSGKFDLDYEQYIEAMGSADDAEFVIWRG